MNIISGLLILYILATGWRGNAGKVVDEVGSDAPGFAPWLMAIITLMFLRSTKLKPIVDPFIVLALIASITKNWETAKTDVVSSYQVLSGKKE